MNEKILPWTEKYRPNRVSDVLSQSSLKAFSQKIVEEGKMPNLLFHGFPGTGKTSTILALAKELFGPLFKKRVLELNASDERGIDVVRGKIKEFSRLSSKEKVSGYPCPPFRIIVLDEVDFMTKDAQSALRRIMETEAENTSFCLLCNHVSRIIGPIKSRCAVFRFAAVNQAEAEQRLEEICKKEGVLVGPDCPGYIVGITEGDMRQAITLLQSTHQLYGGKTLSKKRIGQVAGVNEIKDIENILSTCIKGSNKEIIKQADKIVASVYSIDRLLHDLLACVVSESGLSNRKKIEVIEKISLVERSIIKGADPYLQLLDLFGVISR